VTVPLLGKRPSAADVVPNKKLSAGVDFSVVRKRPIVSESPATRIVQSPSVGGRSGVIESTAVIDRADIRKGIAEVVAKGAQHVDRAGVTTCPGNKAQTIAGVNGQRVFRREGQVIDGVVENIHCHI